VPAILDTDGPALRLGAAGRPAIIKPNLAELERSAGRPLRAGTAGPEPAAEPAAELDAVTQAAQELRGAGAGAVVVTLGAAGLLAVTGEGTWLAEPPGPVSGNPTGAGDAVVAGLARGLVLGQDWPMRLRQAVALGTAAVAAPVAGDLGLDGYRELADRVRVERRDR
jgi:tagatose 6-phosphate kinase